MTGRRPRLDALALSVVLVASGVLVWRELFNGWFPWDDGAMAQVAERVLAGQVPHRDFDDPWTGAWSLFQAGVFKLAGPSLAALRVPIFIAWLAGLAAAFQIARRFSGTLGAGVVALVCAVWSLYAWHFPLLNWYYPPLVLGSAWAVVRYVESGRRGWLWAAGFGAGLAIDIKITGCFLLAALLLWTIARAGDEGRRTTDAGPASRGFMLIALTLAGAYALMVFALVRKLPVRDSAMLHFVLPNAVVALWAARETARARLTATAGVAALARLVLPVLGGVAVAILPLIAWFAAHGALNDLFTGVFVRPAVRLALVWMPPPGRIATVTMLAAPFLLLLGSRAARVGRPQVTIGVALALGVVAGLLARSSPESIDAASMAVRAVPIALPIVALSWGAPRDGDPSHRSIALLLVACSVTAQLLQVPFAYLPYFIYGAPLMILAAAALHAWNPVTAPGAMVFGAAFLLVFGIGHPVADGMQPPPERWAPLPSARAGINVSPQDSAQLDAVGRFVATRPPGPIFVVRDAPQFYFLLGRPNPTRVTYDIVADSASRDATATLARLDRSGVLTVLLVKSDLAMDAPLIALFSTLQRAFPASRRIGGADVRWREQVGDRSAALGPSDQKH